MARVEGKKNYVTYDIWLAYVEELLKEHPGSWSRFERSVPKYAVYKNMNGKVIQIMNYGRFRKTIEHYFSRAKTRIIMGEALDMYSGVGKICMKRVERDFTKPNHIAINWEETVKLGKVWSEEKQKMVYKSMVYFTDDDWVRISWIKHKYIRNETAYEFKPTDGENPDAAGFKNELQREFKKNPLLKYQYIYVSIAAAKSTKT